VGHQSLEVRDRSALILACLGNVAASWALLIVLLDLLVASRRLASCGGYRMLPTTAAVGPPLHRDLRAPRACDSGRKARAQPPRLGGARRDYCYRRVPMRMCRSAPLGAVGNPQRLLEQAHSVAAASHRVARPGGAVAKRVGATRSYNWGYRRR
jgi:hypothetical protein